jgi:hypothetical protein
MRAGQRPARRDAIALGDLLVDDEAQVRQELAVEGDRLAGPFGSVVLERVDVIDKLRVVDVGDPGEVPTAAPSVFWTLPSLLPRHRDLPALLGSDQVVDVPSGVVDVDLHPPHRSGELVVSRP